MRQYQRELEADERALEEESSDDDDYANGLETKSYPTPSKCSRHN
jgi:hypothetical protein